MTKLISFIDDFFLDDEARERCGSELAAYTSILGQQEQLQAALALLLARLQTIAYELLTTDLHERAALLAEQVAITDELSAIPWQIFQTECQRVIAHSTLRQPQGQDDERTAAECQTRLTPGGERIRTCWEAIRETRIEPMHLRKANWEASSSRGYVRGAINAHASAPSGNTLDRGCMPRLRKPVQARRRTRRDSQGASAD